MWRVSLLSSLIFSALLAACSDQTPASSTSAKPEPEQEAKPAAVEAVLPADLAAEATSDTALPGLEERAYIGPLADAYSRIDPTKDGWSTEAFSETATAQLSAMATWLAHPEEDGAKPPALTPAFTTNAWIPATLSDAFAESGLAVRRAAADTSISLSGTEGLLTAAASLRGAFAEHSLKAKFKLYRVEPKEGLVVTRVRVEAQGDSPTEAGQAKQLVAEWDMTWRSASDNIALERIDRLDFEEATYRSSTRTVYEDRTTAVLGKTPSFRDQILRSTDHWRGRLPRDLGLDVVANHGLALGDVNGDLLDDLYLCTEGGLPNRLYLRNPDGTLTDASRESGADWLDYCASALIVDFNNDGKRDLVVGQEWRILFMENDGQGHFDLAFGTSTHAQTYSIAAADYDADGDVDLYVCGYNPAADTVRRGAMGEPIPYHDAQNGGKNMLLRNDGNWEFNEATDEAGFGENNNRFSFAANWVDYDLDGDLDLYVANDYGRNNLYRQDNGKFHDVANELGVEDMSSGMSTAWGDYNRDGNLDLYVSNMFSAAGNRITYQRQFKTTQSEGVREIFQRHARGNTLFEGVGNGEFRDVSVERNVTMGRWAWGSGFVDFNNDGWEDLIVANGFISAEDTGDL